MRTRSAEQRYRERVARVVAFIVAHPLEAHRLEDLAAMAHFSPCHFHRVYSSVVGETVAATVRRVRLALAARLLEAGRQSITQVALAVGYDSPQAFVRDCAATGTRLPLVVVSHGTGGSFLGHHDTAASLADAGFVVAAISHPGDNFQDLGRQAHLSAFATRPVDMKRLIDHMLGTWPGHAGLDADRVGIFGFSRGGHTGLAAVGAIPDWTLRKDLCPAGSMLALCEEIRRNEWPLAPERDPRIRAAVIVDPLSVFDAKGLRHVTVPVQLWASAHGGDGVTPESVEAVRKSLPAPPDWHVAKGATHFAFLAPCAPALASVAPTICRDRPGFDRAVFHAAFNAVVLAFFQRTIGRQARP